MARYKILSLLPVGPRRAIQWYPYLEGQHFLILITEAVGKKECWAGASLPIKPMGPMPQLQNNKFTKVKDTPHLCSLVDELLIYIIIFVFLLFCKINLKPIGPQGFRS